MPTIRGQAEHLKPHPHAKGAEISFVPGMYTLGCCGAQADSLPGLGQVECRAASKTGEAA